jgi:hypothetical protein
VSLAIFAGWTLVGCYRSMRLELNMRNGPLVWFGFLAFMAVYSAGFSFWRNAVLQVRNLDAIALRLGLVWSVYFVLTYIMVLLEPKDRVLYRWIGNQFTSGHFGRAFWSFQAWMMSYLAAFTIAVVLFVHLGTRGNAASDMSVLVSSVGFLTRDISIFVLFQTFGGRRRGDIPAVLVLIALYVLVPSILHAFGADPVLFIFYPRPTQPLLLAPAIVWIEAIAISGWTVTRLALDHRAAHAELANA